MGIKGLTKLILENAPEGYQEITLANLSGQIIAIDASMTLYQFMIAIRQGNFATSLVNANGEPTSHIAGLMLRVAALLELGIRPIYVFDGEPPQAKSDTLLKRKERKEEALKLLEQAMETGDLEEIKKQTSRTVRVSREQSKQAMKFLELCGLPVVEASQEAEAQCAYMVKWGIADVASTEDTDCLTFGTPVLIRNLSNALAISSNKNSKFNSKSPKSHLLRIDLNKTLNGFKLNINQFVDLCILCGCDYCGKLKGVGPKTALSLLQKYKTIEEIIAHKEITCIDENFDYKMARDAFLSPKIVPKEEIKLEWREPNIPELIDFLVVKNNFNQDRVNKFINKLINIRKVKPQQQISSFFKAKNTSIVSKSDAKIETTAMSLKPEVKCVIRKDEQISTIKNPTHESLSTPDKEVDKKNPQMSMCKSEREEGRKRTITLLQFCPSNVKVKKGVSSH
ncbi:flap endonuclease-1 [Babesia microti strain RI]|uniref:Flap endonuclease 1 n=1 Tax=Babesia microti (strain RI) TaxID=1133968 RepID=I7IHD8_BABMR|nr:flap endonuclease-1 [Babesia microti strain RI]CCF75637.1 flap endonuclease-1 [Babesia microti strain RI]|eukprot:XP_012650045.1 flap endonuclease-1 [Babesia microti strain RI]